MRLSKKFKIILVLILSLIFVVCELLVNVKQPVELIWDKTGKKTDNLIIFLPGLYDTADKFRDEKFFSIARKEGVKADMVSANINVFHLLKNMMIKRIEIDIFHRAKKDGYKNIWLVGVSLGGLNSLLFYRKHSSDICGVVTLAPYVANSVLIDELKNAKEIRYWQPALEKDKSVLNKKLETLWLWLKQRSLNNKLGSIYLGYGKQDRYVEAIELFGKVLRKKNVVNIDGRHDWDTGQKIWQRQLSSRFKTGLLQSCK